MEIPGALVERGRAAQLLAAAAGTGLNGSLSSPWQAGAGSGGDAVPALLREVPGGKVGPDSEGKGTSRKQGGWACTAGLTLTRESWRCSPGPEPPGRGRNEQDSCCILLFSSAPPQQGPS